MNSQELYEKSNKKALRHEKLFKITSIFVNVFMLIFIAFIVFLSYTIFNNSKKYKKLNNVPNTYQKCGNDTDRLYY